MPPQQLSRPTEVADAKVRPPQAIGCFRLQGAIAELDREREGLLACRHGAVVVSRDPEDIGHLGQHPSQPDPIVERPAQASASPTRASCRLYSPSWLSETPKARRSSMASALVSLSSGRCARAWRACSKEVRRLAERGGSQALEPACWQ